MSRRAFTHCDRDRLATIGRHFRAQVFARRVEGRYANSAKTQGSSHSCVLCVEGYTTEYGVLISCVEGARGVSPGTDGKIGLNAMHHARDHEYYGFAFRVMVDNTHQEGAGRERTRDFHCPFHKFNRYFQEPVTRSCMCVPGATVE